MKAISYNQLKISNMLDILQLDGTRFQLKLKWSSFTWQLNENANFCKHDPKCKLSSLCKIQKREFVKTVMSCVWILCVQSTWSVVFLYKS